MCSDALCGSTFECPNNLVQSQNITECEPTCQSLHFLNSTHCGGPRWSGCSCPAGLVLDNGQCISPDECPCLHHGETYQPGIKL